MRVKLPVVVTVVLVPLAVALPIAVPSAYTVIVAPATVFGTVNWSSVSELWLFRLVMLSVELDPVS